MQEIELLRARLLQLHFIKNRVTAKLSRQHQHLLIESADRLIQLNQLEERITKERIKVLGKIIADSLDQLLSIGKDWHQNQHPALQQFRVLVVNINEHLRHLESRVYITEGLTVNLQQFNSLLSKLGDQLTGFLDRHRDYLKQLSVYDQKKNVYEKQYEELEMLGEQITLLTAKNENKLLAKRAQKTFIKNQMHNDKLWKGLFQIPVKIET